MPNHPAAAIGEPQPNGPPGFAPLPPGEVVAVPGRGAVFTRVAPGPAADAPCLVLLHGLTATADLNWFAAFEPLAAAHRVVAPDQRGHGGGVAAERFTLEDAADDVAGVLGALGVDRAVVVGYSMGGAVAQVLWRRRPELVAGLVLCATAADYRERTARGRYLEQPRRVAVAALGRTLPAGLRARALDRLRAASSASLQSDTDRSSPIQHWAAGELARSDPFRVADAGAVLRRYVAPGDLAGIDVPVSLVVTTRDDVVPTADQRALVGLLPAGTTVHEVDAGHGAFVEDLERFVPALVAACADVDARLADPG
ncbi:MAG: alpha/beta hydrolase [Actinobacteria bacterium]|nr:alpha/beta hydrolase [Actinomycetota bacterium]